MAYCERFAWLRLVTNNQLSSLRIAIDVGYEFELWSPDSEVKGCPCGTDSIRRYSVLAGIQNVKEVSQRIL